MGRQSNNTYTTSKTNVFDLEQDELTEICMRTEKNHSYKHELNSLPPKKETQQISVPNVLAKGLINTKGILFMSNFSIKYKIMHI